MSCCLMLSRKLIDISDGPELPSFSPYDYLDRVTLILWPSSIVGLAEAPGNEVLISTVSILGNVALYLFTGIFFWLGVNKHRGFFIVPLLTLGTIWWKLLSVV